VLSSFRFWVSSLFSFSRHEFFPLDITSAVSLEKGIQFAPLLVSLSCPPAAWRLSLLFHFFFSWSLLHPFPLPSYKFTPSRFRIEMTVPPALRGCSESSPFGFFFVLRLRTDGTPFLILRGLFWHFRTYFYA